MGLIWISVKFFAADFSCPSNGRRWFNGTDRKRHSDASTPKRWPNRLRRRRWSDGFWGSSFESISPGVGDGTSEFFEEAGERQPLRLHRLPGAFL